MTSREEWFVWHINQIPNLLEHIRSQIITVGAARLEGRVTGSKDVARLPYNSQAADDADLLWALLIQLGEDIHDKIGGPRPQVLVEGWRVNGEAQGTLAKDGHAQTRNRARQLVSWMINRSHHIALLDLGDSVEYLVGETRRLHGKYPEAPAELSYRPRGCPVCGQRRVHVFWLTSRVEDAQVECTHCGYQVESSMMSIVDTLLEGDQPARLA